MKAHYKTANGRLTFEVQGEAAKDLFRQLAEIQEIFDSETTCGLCNGKDLRLVARKVEDFDFYELACQAPGCRGQFSFGQKKKGGALFPRRKDEDGRFLPNRGWSKYEKAGAAAEPSDPAGRSPAAGNGQPEQPKQEKRDGVPMFTDWKTAEASLCWGGPWLNIAGKLFKLSEDGANYNEVRRETTPAR